MNGGGMIDAAGGIALLVLGLLVLAATVGCLVGFYVSWWLVVPADALTGIGALWALCHI